MSFFLPVKNNCSGRSFWNTNLCTEEECHYKRSVEMIVVLLYIHYRPKVLDHIDFFSLNFKRESSYKSLKKEIYFFYDCMQLSNNLNPNKYKVIIITVKVTIFLSITSINYYRENYWLLSNKWKSMLREVIPKQC